MDDKKEMLGKAPLGKHLFKPVILTVISKLINMLYNIVERIFIGHMPVNGDLALTSLGVCLPIMKITAFVSSVGTGGAQRAFIFIGKKDCKGTRRYLKIVLHCKIVISVILTILWLCFN